MYTYFVFIVSVSDMVYMFLWKCVCTLCVVCMFAYLFICRTVIFLYVCISLVWPLIQSCLSVDSVYSQTCLSGHLPHATTQNSPQENYYCVKDPVNSGHLSIMATFFCFP